MAALFSRGLVFAAIVVCGDAACEGAACPSRNSGGYLLQRRSAIDVTMVTKDTMASEGEQSDEELEREVAQKAKSTSKRRRGAPWTAIEMEAIRETMFKIFKMKKGAIGEDLCEYYGDTEYPCILERFEPNVFESCDSENVSDAISLETIKCFDNTVTNRMPSGAFPNGPRFMRLGFHDCVRYTDGTGGCDGCLNFDGMFVMKNMDEKSEGPKRKSDLPYDIIKGNNNNLAGTADLLERIYTDHTYGKQSDFLTMSLKDSGKSRADLWAYASLLAAEFYMLQNNERRESNDPPHLYNYESLGLPHPCKISPARPFAFYSGRADCPEADKPPSNTRYRDYETAKEENGANPHASGKEVATWFETEFGFTGRETVAIMGVHVAGNFDSMNGAFRYTWCGRELGQDNILNNVYYRMLAYKPIYLLDDLAIVDEAKATGDPVPPPREIRWKLNGRGLTPSRGPVQWFMYTYPEEGSGLTKDAGTQIHTTMINTDIGLFLNFDTTEGGWPIRSGEEGSCVKLALNVSHDEPILDLHDAAETCLQTAMSGEKTLAEIVVEYADNQDFWWSDFTEAMEKMLNNGYDDLEPHAMTTTTTTPPPEPRGSEGECTNNWCCGGYKSKSVCCAASCGGCGGNGCNKLEGGRENCCTKNIKENGVICQSKWDLVCTIP